jgi:hypothetical protein
LRCPRPCRASRQARVGPPWYGRRWSAGVIWPPRAPWTGSISTPPTGWPAHTPIKCGWWMSSVLGWK